MRTTTKTAAALAALLITALPAPAATSILARDTGHDEARAEAKVQRIVASRGLAIEGYIRAARSRPVILPQPVTPKLQAASKGAPLQVGFGRDIAALADEPSTAAALDWEAMPDASRVAALRITSTGATSLRVALRVAHLPDAAIVRFQAAGDSRLFEFRGDEVNAATELFWSPLLTGDTALVEVQLPRDADPGSVRLAVPLLSHLVTSPATNFAVAEKSASCEIDAMCVASQWGAEMNAVARMVFTSGGSTFLCTGTLLADDNAASTVPYFLSASHCISTQASASSLVTFWFYRSAACNSAAAGAPVQLTGGATLLYASGAADATYTDTSFMRLANLPPAGAVYAGWSASLAGTSTSVTGLHHPGGEWLKVASGSITGTLRCTPPSSGEFTCNAPGATGFYSAGWASGITEPGSSGSGLFRDDGTLVGQLYGGSGTCAAPSDDIYGRFDLAYNTALKQWLSPPTITVAKAGTGSGTVTSNPLGINCGSTCSMSLAQGTSVTLSAAPAAGSVFKGWTGACTGTAASCSVTMNAAANVIATFAPAPVTLGVTTTGGGTITSNPAGINCGSACAASFTVGSAVTLSAAPFAGMAFQGWSGACTGTAACTLTMNAAKAVTATFAAAATDVSIAQAILPTQPVVGGDALVTLTAANAGPLRATAVTVTYTVPTGWQLIWMTPACGAAASHVICTVMALSPGASQEFDVVMRPASSGNASSVVTVAATESDPALADNTSTLTLSAADAPVAKAVERYRLYSPVTLEHHFTTDANEYAVLGQYGWVQEGTAGKVLDNPGSFNGVEAVPYYRLYNSITRWHHWTTDANEYYTLRGYPGWNAEGIDGYILPNAAAGSTQLFRLVYPNGTGLHHWTIDPDEYAALIATYGWVGEGGAGFVIE